MLGLNCWQTIYISQLGIWKLYQGHFVTNILKIFPPIKVEIFNIVQKKKSTVLKQETGKVWGVKPSQDNLLHDYVSKSI